MEQDSTKNRMVLVKINRVSKYTLSVQKLCYSQDKYKANIYFHIQLQPL